MKNKREFIIAIIFLLIGLVIAYFVKTKAPATISPKIENSSFNQSSKDYAVMGLETWTAFECSSLASKVDDSKEAGRLFIFGYEKGKKFIGALKAEKIKQEDIDQKVPIGVIMLLQGPSEEFILGRIYSFAEEEALGEVFKTDNEFNSSELQKSIAENKFRESNCQLIGK